MAQCPHCAKTCNSQLGIKRIGIRLTSKGLTRSSRPQTKRVGGPALIGFVAHHTSLYISFLLLAALVVLQTLIAAYVYRKVL